MSPCKLLTFVDACKLPRWRSGRVCQSVQETQETQIQSFGKIPWRRKWQPTPVFLPGKFHRQRNPAGYSPSGHKESDTTECTHRHTWNPQDPGLGHWHLTGDSDAHQSLHRAVISKVGNQGNLDLRRELYRYLAYGLTAALVPSFKMNR